MPLREAAAEAKHRASEAKFWKRVAENEVKQRVDLERMISGALEHLGLKAYEAEMPELFEGEQVMGIVFSDWHIGMQYRDRFDKDIAAARVHMVVDQACEYIVETNPSRVVIFILGDILDGAVELRTGHNRQIDCDPADRQSYPGVDHEDAEVHDAEQRQSQATAPAPRLKP